MEAIIPEDLRHLKDFPTFDASFQDKPNFRQSLSHWAAKTDKIAAALTNFADAFQQFHNSGLEHMAASSRIMRGMQELSSLTTNSKGSSISSTFSTLAEQMGSVLNYQEVFLGQTQLVNVVPIKELAATFSNLKKIHEELQFYRTQYITAAEELCSCRHISNIADKSHFNSLTQECYTAQKTYRLLLSKYLTALRQANTKDMVTVVRRCVEHITSQFVYFNNCYKALNEAEPEVNTIFSQTKQWSEFYTNELVLWGKLHTSVQRHIMAEFQLEIGLVHQQSDDSLWAESSNRVCKPILRKLPHGSTHGSIRDTKPLQLQASSGSFSQDWVNIEEEECSGLDKVSRHSQPPPIPPKQQRTHSSPLIGTRDTLGSEMPQHKQIVVTKEILTESCRSISDPDLISSMDKERSSVSSGEVDLEVSVQSSTTNQIRVVQRSAKTKPPHKIRYSDNSLERSDVKNILERLGNMSSSVLLPGEQPVKTNGTTGGGRLKSVLLSRSKNKAKQHKDIHKIKKNSKIFHSSDNLLEQSSGMAVDKDGQRSSSGSPQEMHSPVPKKKNGTGIFKLKKKKNSIALHPTPSPLEDPSGKETADSPPAHFSSVSSENGVSEPVSGGLLGDGDDSSPRHHVVSLPVHPEREKNEPDAYFNLQTLVQPVNKNWVKCGYLWLRMKLPNGRYAWTHIYCVVDKERGELMIQEQSLPEPRKLENLMLCNTRPCLPNYIDRNFCFRVITPSTEHLFQTINENQMSTWVAALQETTEEALKHSDLGSRKPPTTQGRKFSRAASQQVLEAVPDAMNIILNIPGNNKCADCSSTVELEWTSVNLGIVICIKCSGVHRGLGTHISKVRSLNLDSWDRQMVEFMQSQGNTKSNGYYESSLGEGLFTEDIKKPTANASKEERKLFIQQKYVALAFVPECGDDRSTQL